MIQTSCQWIKFWKQLYKGNQFWYPLCPEWFKFPVNESSFGNSCKGICLWYPVSRRIIKCFGKLPRIILFIYWIIVFLEPVPWFCSNCLSLRVSVQETSCRNGSNCLSLRVSVDEKQCQNQFQSSASLSSKISYGPTFHTLILAIKSRHFFKSKIWYCKIDRNSRIFLFISGPMKDWCRLLNV